MSDESRNDSRDEPLAELATEIANRRDARSTAEVDEAGRSPDGSERSRSQREGAEFDGFDVDESDVWSELGDDPIAVPASVEPDDDAERHQVSKGLCHNCRFFSEPPAFQCTHDGTEISEVVDADRFLVVDCPMVGEDAVFETFD